MAMRLIIFNIHLWGQEKRRVHYDDDNFDAQ